MVDDESRKEEVEERDDSNLSTYTGFPLCRILMCL